MSTTAKPELRRALRARRSVLTPADQARAARALYIQLTALRQFRVAQRIACYLPVDGEIDPWRVLGHIHALGKTCYLPVLSRIRHDRLWFAPVHNDARFLANRYGILEPVVPARRLVRAQALDLILLPLVGFDRTGRRLGMGKGFYDKSLAFLGQRQHWRKPHLLGLAHDIQCVDNLPADDWDVPLDGVVTDRAFYPATP